MSDVDAVQLGGTRQWIRRLGPEGAPMLVYLHGGPGVAELATLPAFATPLLDRFQVVGWDQRGAGRSRADAVTVDGLVRDLIELVGHLRDAHRPPSVVLVGHSWGGLLGLSALRREPALADGFVGIGPLVAGAATDVAARQAAVREAEARGARLLATLLRREVVPFGSRGAASLRMLAYLWALGGVVRPRARLARLVWMLATFRGYPLADRLLFLSRASWVASRLQPEIGRLDLRSEPFRPSLPVLVCVGRHDLVTPPALAREAFAVLGARCTEWHVFDRGAHSVHYEDPDGFAAVLAGWHERRLGSRPPADVPAVARDRVLRLGWNATSYQVLTPGLQRWLAPRHEAVVGYVRHAGVRVAAGAPVAAREDLPEVVAAFEADARRHGERVCWFGAEARLEAVVGGRDDHARVQVGAQPVWDPQGWPEIVRRRRSVRSQLARARNKGLRVEPWPSPTPERLVRLAALQAAWLARKGLPRLHFLTEPDLLGSLGDRRLLVALVGDAPVGYLVASPVPLRGGWLVEQLVRVAAAPNGTAESLVDALMRAAAADGSRWLTLGLVPLARHAAAPDPDAPAWLRLTLRWVRSHGRRFYDFAGLEAFKAKLAPDRWEPVYAIADERRFSPRTLYAVAGAFSGGSPLVLVGRAVLRAAGTELRGLRASGSRAGGRTPDR